MDFSTWLNNRKPPQEVVTAVEVAGLLLGAYETTNTFRYRVEKGSNYECALKMLAEDPEKCHTTLQNLDTNQVSNSVASVARSKVQEEGLDFTPKTLYSQGGDEMRLLGEYVLAFLERMKQENKRPIVTQKIIGVCVDGSRMSYMALNLAARLRNKGQLVVMHVSDPALDDGNPAHDHWRPAFLEQNLQNTCKDNYGIPDKDLKIIFQEKNSSQSVEKILENIIIQQGVQVLVLGSHGQSGPRVASIGSVASFALNLPRLPTIVVNSHAQHLVLAPSQQPFTFMLAVGGKGSTAESILYMLQATLELMRPEDRLLVVHVASEDPAAALVGEEDGPVKAEGGETLPIDQAQEGPRSPRTPPIKLSSLKKRQTSMTNQMFFTSSRKEMRGGPTVSVQPLARANSVATSFDQNLMKISVQGLHLSKLASSGSRNMDNSGQSAESIETDALFTQQMLNDLAEIMNDAQANGTIQTVKKIPTKTVAEHICEAVETCQVDFLVVKYGGSKTVSQECARVARCSVVMLKL